MHTKRMICVGVKYMKTLSANHWTYKTKEVKYSGSLPRCYPRPLASTKMCELITLIRSSIQRKPNLSFAVCRSGLGSGPSRIWLKVRGSVTAWFLWSIYCRADQCVAWRVPLYMPRDAPGKVWFLPWWDDKVAKCGVDKAPTCNRKKPGACIASVTK